MLVFLNGVKGSEMVSVLLRKRKCGSAGVKGDEVPAERKHASVYVHVSARGCAGVCVRVCEGV